MGEGPLLNFQSVNEEAASPDNLPTPWGTLIGSLQNQQKYCPPQSRSFDSQAAKSQVHPRLAGQDYLCALKFIINMSSLS